MPTDAPPTEAYGGMTGERLTWHLENWAEWHRPTPRDYGRGAPTKAGSGIGRSAHSDFDSMVHAADVRCAEAVEALVDGLTVVERSALHHWHLGAVYRFPRAGRGAELAYERARAAIARGLTARGIW